MKIDKINAPDLDIDRMFKERYNTKISPTGHVERRIIANLINHLDHHGIKVVSVYDGEEVVPASDMKAAMEIIFNLDEAHLQVIAKDAANENETHNILLILGNGVDCICDWGYFADDRDGFNAAMDEFDAEEHQ